MEKANYIIDWGGEISWAIEFPDKLATSEYTPWVHIVRLSDLHVWWHGMWYPMKQFEPTGL